MNKQSQTLLNMLSATANSAWYWIALIVLGIGLETTALLYQYVWEEYPCVLCIHVRLLVMCFIVIAIGALWARRVWWLNTMSHILITLVMAIMFERSYQLLGIERGFIEGSCSFNLGLPNWLAFDKWLPAVFEVQDSCSYTPELLFGITMAESLIVLSALLTLLSLALALVSVIRKKA